jgi:hypothetical protein
VSDPTGAQGRHPRAGTGYGSRYYHGHHGHYPYYGYPYYPYWGYGGYPYFAFGYGGYPGFYGGGYYGGYAYDDGGDVRVLVDPSETRVFVDGAYAGTADEFDGLFQRLHVAPGRHEIALKLEGYRTHRMRVYVPYAGTLKLHHDMIEGTGEDSFEDLAGDRYDDEEAARGQRYEDDRYVANPRSREPYERPAPDGDSATLRLQVSPPGASVYVDGEFRGTGRELGRLELAPGSHRVEVVHPGLRTFEQEVVLEPGRSEDLQVELAR